MPRPRRNSNPNQELANLGRVAVLGQLSGAFAHELAQPLTAMLAKAEAALQIAMRDATAPSELQEMLRAIIKDAVRASDTIQRLRSLLARGEVQRQPVDLNQIVRDMVALVRSELIARHVSVTTRLARRVSWMLADVAQMQQVLLNLIVNACDAMADTPRAARQLIIATRVAEDGRKVQCSVVDRGHGIPADYGERIFEPFISTKTHGLGLGLAICRSIIEAHGGRLWAENAKGGATFHFTLNAVQPQRSREKRRRPAAHVSLAG
jgi:C4-dicarboxylate-specific signal transduction histidine kinase